MNIRIRKRLFFTSLFFYCTGAVIFILALGQFVPVCFQIGRILLLALGVTTLLETILLLGNSMSRLEAKRTLDERLSNGSENTVVLSFKNLYRFPVSIVVIDELPVQLQVRNFEMHLKLKPGESVDRSYDIRPIERGEYWFGALNVFIKSPLRLLERRVRFSQDQMAKVYPAFKEMRQFEMMAISNRLTEFGIKKIRRIGHQMEFDQIRDYTKGDDYRTINWKATARKDHLMVNQYQDEKSQQVISVIDLGRTMKMPFNGMSLLDYAINTSLVLSKIALLKQDKAGLVTFNNRVRSLVAPQRNNNQMQLIMETLYNQKTHFEEHSMQALFATVRRRINQRSLLFLYTNFTSLNAAKRQLPLLQKMAADHLLVVVFFENTELVKLTSQKAKDMEGIYIKTIAEKLAYDKKQICFELERYGIHSVLTEPGQLTVSAINKYLELKARGYI